MSNIYDSANELSRGLRELPEYKAVKAAKDAIQADAEASLQTMLPFKKKFKNWSKQGKFLMLAFKRKWKASVSKFKGITSYQNSSPSNNNFLFIYPILKKLSLNPFQNC